MNFDCWVILQNLSQEIIHEVSRTGLRPVCSTDKELAVVTILPNDNLILLFFRKTNENELAFWSPQADETLFSGILRNRNHVLHCLLPPEQQTGYTLRPRAHDRSRLPGDVNPLLRQNFIYRSLSNNFFYSN